MPELSGASHDNEWVLVAVFLPNGEAIRPGPRYLVDERGRAAELIVEPWSGRLSIRPFVNKLASDEPRPSGTASVGEETGR